jgi:hypothetical protein
MPEPVTRDKPRIGTRGWSLILVASVLLLIGGLFVVFTVGAERKFQFAVEKYAPAALEPAGPTTAPADPEANAATHLHRAIDRMSFDSEDEQLIYPTSRLPLTSEELAVVTHIAESNRAALDEIRQARACAMTEWGYGIDSVVRGAPIHEYRTLSQLAWIVRCDLTRQHVAGNDAECVEGLRDLWSLGEAARKLQPSMIAHLIGGAIEGMTDECIAEIAPDLRIGSAARDAPPAEVRALMKSLLDERGMRRGYADGWLGLHAEMINQVRQMSSRPVVGTMAKLDAAKALMMASSYREAGLAGTYAAAVAIRARAMANPPTWHALPGEFWVGFEQSLTTHFRMTCDRRMTALVLAIALYRADHRGELPPTLADLVPAYVAKVPSDPYRADDGPFGYVRSGERPAVYSVSENGTDDGASTRPSNPRNSRSAIDPQARWAHQDALMYLVRLPKLEPDQPDQ